MIRTTTLCVCLLSSLYTPGVRSYAKVARNGQELGQARNDQSSWIGRSSNASESEGRSVKNIAITMSPVYVPPRTPNLQNGQAIDYPSTRRYSTLDREMIAKLDHKQIQDRYHPHTITFNGKPMSNGDDEDDDVGKPMLRPTTGSSDSYDFPGPPYAPDYKPPDYTKGKPVSKPPTMMISEYPGPTVDQKPSDQPYYTGHDHQPDYPDYPGDEGTYNTGDHPPKPIEFSIGPVDRPPTGDRPYDPKYHHHHHHHNEPHEVIYDHVPDYHDHYHHEHYQPETTTEQPDMNDQRLDKRPYSYYFIGKKLWYVPLYFSIYFIIYIAALVLKSIARHKITFPEHLAQAVNHSRNRPEPTWWEYTERVLEGIENFAEKFGRVS